MTIAIGGALLVREGRLLLVHRRPGRTAYPDCWNVVGSHVGEGETPQQVLRRECREELGMEIDAVEPFAMAVHDPALTMRAFLATSWVG